MDKHQESVNPTDNEFNGEIVDQANGSNELPSSERTNATVTNLQTMNEYCLYEIFAMSSLDAMDLCSIAHTCTRLQQIVQRVVPKTIRIQSSIVNDLREYDVDYKVSKNRTRKDIQRIFKDFGSLFTAVKIEIQFEAHDETFLLELLKEHCDGDKLKSLAICGIENFEFFAVNLKPLFKRLHKLDLQYVSVPDDATLFANLDSLVEMRVDDVECCGAILENIFPKLRRFEYKKLRIVPADSIDNIAEQQTLETVTMFIARHPKMRRLGLWFYCHNVCEKEILQTVVNNCTELEELGFEIGDRRTVAHLQGMENIKSLRSLRLWFVSFEDFAFLSTLTALRELRLICCTLSNDAKEFAGLSQLTKLDICHSRGPVDVVGIVRRLTNLQELIIHDE